MIAPGKRFDPAESSTQAVVERIKKVYGVIAEVMDISIQEDMVTLEFRDATPEKFSEAMEKLKKGVAIAEKGQLLKALKLFQEVLTVIPESVDARRNMAKIYLELRNIEKAKKLLYECLQLDPKDVWSSVLLGNIYGRNEHNLDVGAFFYEKSLENHPDDPMVLCNYAALMVEKGDFMSAEVLFKKTLKIQDVPNAYYGLALLYRMGNHLEAAKSVLETFFSRSPHLRGVDDSSIYKEAKELYEDGQVAEDLRTQVLGQLSSRLSYDRLYQEAILDPTLKRTRQELEVAMTNANLAREVVFELFQDLDSFKLGDYRRFEDEGKGMQRLLAFAQRAARVDGGEFRPIGKDVFVLQRPDAEPVQFTTDRDRALQEDGLSLLGLEHPVVKQWLDAYTSLKPEDRALVGSIEGNGQRTGLITIWLVVVHGKGGQIQRRVVRLGLTEEGERAPHLERLSQNLLRTRPSQAARFQDRKRLITLVNGTGSELLHRELVYTGFLPEEASYSSQLLACIGVSG